MFKTIKRKVLTKIIYSASRKAGNKSLINIMSGLKRISRIEDKIKLDFIIKLMKDNHPMVGFIKKLTTQRDKKSITKFMENLIFKGLLEGVKIRDAALKNGEGVPVSLLISPSMRCNISCKGCYAHEYSKSDDLPFELLDKILNEGRELGIAFYTILGGEPFIRKDLFDLFKKHKDLYFHVYTNGTLITEEVCKKIKKLGNILLEISVEGFEKETDERRGKGIYAKVMKSMDLLNKYGIPFGCSVCVTNKNVDLVFSNEFIDFLIAKGALIVWYFLYMPVHAKPDLSLMPTPEQRKRMLDRGKDIRKNKEIFIVDFWNDAPFVGGCIAGKHYAHINSEGWVEPCIFTHFSDGNIKDKSLKECFNSPYFKALRSKQPYNDNLYLPCQWIDNPEVSRDMHKEFKLHATHKGADDILKDEKVMKDIDKYAKGVSDVFSEEWKKRKVEIDVKAKELAKRKADAKSKKKK